MIVNINIENQLLSVENPKRLINRSNNYLELNFNFLTEDWEDKIKYVILKNSRWKNFQFKIESESTIIVPGNVLIGRWFEITVYGISEDNERITTNLEHVLLRESGYTNCISPVNEDGGSCDVITDLYKRKLDAENYIIDGYIDDESENPVMNKVIASTITSQSETIEQLSQDTVKIRDFDDCFDNRMNLWVQDFIDGINEL